MYDKTVGTSRSSRVRLRHALKTGTNGEPMRKNPVIPTTTSCVSLCNIPPRYIPSMAAMHNEKRSVSWK